MSTVFPFRDHALEHAEQGRPVFPLAPGTNKPLISKEKGGNGYRDATRDPDTINEWCRLYPRANIGTPCGRYTDSVTGEVYHLSIVIENDRRHGGSDQMLADQLGLDLRAMLEQHCIVRTPTLGKHIHLAWPEEMPDDLDIRNSDSELAPGIDVRGSGGYVALDDSERDDGVYVLMTKHAPAPIPQRLLLRLISAKRARSAAPVDDGEPLTGEEAQRQGEHWLRWYLAKATGGVRNDLGFHLACQLRDTGLHRAQAEVYMRRYAEGVPQPGDQPRYTVDEALASLDQAYKDPTRRRRRARYEFVQFVSSLKVPLLNSRALHGLAGRIVKIIAPATEACVPALLLELLTAFGNAVGRGPHFMVGKDRHGVNLYVAKVGDTSRGRKGHSWGWTENLMGRAVLDWVKDHILSGLSTSQGLIHALRDKAPDEDEQDLTPMRQKKIVLVRERELAQVLKFAALDGNAISTLLRDGWDGHTLNNPTKHAPEKATDPHISIVADITRADLTRHLAREDYSNGFSNRFLWCLTSRSQLLPDGGEVDEAVLNTLGQALASAIAFASKVERMQRDDDAKALWHDTYMRLAEEAPPGLAADVTARAEAMILRLSCIYALLDKQSTISKEHLQAAIAVWDYCEASACVIFGGKLGYRMADTALEALRKAAPGTLTKSDLHAAFHRNPKAEDIDRALAWLAEQGLAESVTDDSDPQHPVEHWYAVDEPLPLDAPAEASHEAAGEEKTRDNELTNLTNSCPAEADHLEAQPPAASAAEDPPDTPRPPDDSQDVDWTSPAYWGD
jgi:hypothetical protein